MVRQNDTNFWQALKSACWERRKFAFVYALATAMAAGTLVIVYAIDGGFVLDRYTSSLILGCIISPLALIWDIAVVVRRNLGSQSSFHP
jgi:hypothetical protein